MCVYGVGWKKQFGARVPVLLGFFFREKQVREKYAAAVGAMPKSKREMPWNGQKRTRETPRNFYSCSSINSRWIPI